MFPKLLYFLFGLNILHPYVESNSCKGSIKGGKSTKSLKDQSHLACLCRFNYNLGVYCTLFLPHFQYLNFKGILCIGFLKRARQKTEISREQAVKDLEVSSRHLLIMLAFLYGSYYRDLKL